MLPGDRLFEEERGSSRTIATNCTSTTTSSSLTRHACQTLLNVDGCRADGSCSTSSDASTADASGTYSPLSPIVAREGRNQETPSRERSLQLISFPPSHGHPIQSCRPLPFPASKRPECPILTAFMMRVPVRYREMWPGNAVGNRDHAQWGARGVLAR